MGDEIESEAGGEDEGDKTGGIFANVSAPSDDEGNAGDGSNEGEITDSVGLRELL